VNPVDFFLIRIRNTFSEHLFNIQFVYILVYLDLALLCCPRGRAASVGDGQPVVQLGAS
jgi:hypothetical protein